MGLITPRGDEPITHECNDAESSMNIAFIATIAGLKAETEKRGDVANESDGSEEK